jgi:redox-sensitive bicupin YhaK (pirin superfamily)
MKIRPANTRGFLDAGWITSSRTFSNNSYWDPRYISWGNLKVINDDVQQPGNMVPNHEHRNFDILGYMVEGELEHTDSLGNTIRAQPGQIQHMWCGSSIWHTEASVGSIPARYLQIWITPKDEHRDSAPYYEIIEKSPEFGPIAVELKQAMTISAGILTETITSTDSYLYVVSGSCLVNGILLQEGDGAELNNDTILPADCPHLVLFENHSI